ncbi:MAG: hypothetical protein ABI890_05405 [Lapillicoccus sp.]
MTEFSAQLRERARESLRLLAEAEACGDDYSVDVHTGELESISRMADEHDVRVPELTTFRASHAA